MARRSIVSVYNDVTTGRMPDAYSPRKSLFALLCERCKRKIMEWRNKMFPHWPYVHEDYSVTWPHVFISLGMAAFLPSLALFLRFAIGWKVVATIVWIIYDVIASLALATAALIMLNPPPPDDN